MPTKLQQIIEDVLEQSYRSTQVSFVEKVSVKKIPKDQPIVGKSYSEQNEFHVRQAYLEHAYRKGVDLSKGNRTVSDEKLSKFLLDFKCRHESVEEDIKTKVIRETRWR